MFKLAEERLPGKVKVEVYPNSTLFGDADEIEALRANKADAGHLTSKFEPYTKQPRCSTCRSCSMTWRPWKRSRSATRAANCCAPWPARYLWPGLLEQRHEAAFRHSRAAPAGRCQGLVFRIQPSSVLEAQFAMLGATAKQLSYAETLKAMQAGSVQGTENTWSNLAGQKIDSVQPYITETNHGALSYMLITSSAFWTSIPIRPAPNWRASSTRSPWW